MKCVFGFKTNCPTISLRGGCLSDIHSNATVCPHRSIAMFQKMMIWKFPSGTSLVHRQFWWCVHLFSIHATVCLHRSIAMFQKWRYKDFLQVYLCFPDCCRGSLNHGLSLNNIAPNMIWMCSFNDYLSLNIIVFSSLTHHLIIFHCLIADLNTAYFSFSRFTVLPPSCSTFQWVTISVNVISIKDYAYPIDVLPCLIIFLVLESTLIFQRSCLFKV